MSLIDEGNISNTKTKEEGKCNQIIQEIDQKDLQILDKNNLILTENFTTHDNENKTSIEENVN